MEPTMKYLYTATKLATSTCQRKLLGETTPATIAAAHPFTLWTEEDLSPAVIFPPKTSYSMVWRSPNNRASRRANRNLQPA